jgi:hypothetical protein
MHARRLNRRRPTYAPLPQALRGRTLDRFLEPPDVASFGSRLDHLAALTRNYLRHRFDLLGSGWVEVREGMKCRGLEGHHYPFAGLLPLEDRMSRAYRPHVRALRALLDEDYVPIDWQIDFKSGYRWSERCWYGDIRYGHLPGVDVKVPWELARLQHLPQLALAHACARAADGRFHAPEIYFDEFRNQSLDFIAANPPRFGVNWACTMDVGIRIANLLVGHDLFRCGAVDFDPLFEETLLAATFDHARFIVANLEWDPRLRANHYLANVAGLLFAAAYLPSTDETDLWLAFAVEELIAETEHQFDARGANFEASTCYHRLSAEMVAYASAIACAVPAERWERLAATSTERFRASRGVGLGHHVIAPPQERFPERHWQRLAGMADFVVALTKPDGHMPQIGDNDSGRFLKLVPTYRGTGGAGDDAWSEDHLDHRHVVAALNGFFDNDEWRRFSPEHRLETEIVSALSDCRVLGPAARAEAAGRATTGPRKDHPGAPTKRSSVVRWLIEPGGPDLTDGLQARAWTCFGVYLFRSHRLYLLVRCGPVGQDGYGGHAHNDQLAVELQIDGEDWAVDPGTYLYTPIPEARDLYRSVRAHYAPQRDGDEPNGLDRGLFRLPDRAQPECAAFERHRFVGRHKGFGGHTTRAILVTPRVIEIVDSIPVPPGTTATDVTHEVHRRTDLRRLLEPPPFSPGYGMIGSSPPIP